jgi:hypothetical protein
LRMLRMFLVARESACVGGPDTPTACWTMNSVHELSRSRYSPSCSHACDRSCWALVEEFWRAGAIDEAPGNTRLRKRVTLGASSDTGLADSGADHNDA